MEREAAQKIDLLVLAEEEETDERVDLMSAACRTARS